MLFYKSAKQSVRQTDKKQVKAVKRVEKMSKKGQMRSPLPQNQKNALSDVLFNSGASKGARTLDLNLGKVAL